MTHKLRDVEDKKDREALEAEIDHSAQRIGMGKWEDSKNRITGVEKFGLCSTCKNFEAARNKYGIVWARCSSIYDMRISDEHPITECTDYTKRGTLSLEMMMGMAYLIDPGKRTIPVGFESTTDAAKILRKRYGRR